MPENTPLQVSAKPSVTVEQAARARRLRRAFQRKYLRRKPTRIEAAALDRAALMTALAEQLARDPTANPEVVNRVDGNAARARAALAELASGSKSAKAVSLHHYLEDRTSA